ncbi:MAG TPA: hypothetical protein VGE35_01805 [Candidatus Paceibacterota bacterium]
MIPVNANTRSHYTVAGLALGHKLSPRSRYWLNNSLRFLIKWGTIALVVTVPLLAVHPFVLGLYKSYPWLPFAAALGPGAILSTIYLVFKTPRETARLSPEDRDAINARLRNFCLLCASIAMVILAISMAHPMLRSFYEEHVPLLVGLLAAILVLPATLYYLVKMPRGQAKRHRETPDLEARTA